ncbi:MAG: hypothetical protein JO097_07685 [Acidobacteriaceae bacterium]|nr:hypothetical protein [Acidobacteriaceae bacterium]
MSATPVVCDAINRDWIDRLIIRWKTADDFVAGLNDLKRPAELAAFRRVIRRDIPALLQELTRLRPDLALGLPRKTDADPGFRR